MTGKFTKSGLKRLWRPKVRIKPDEEEEKIEAGVKEQPKEIVLPPANPLQEFFDDMSLIQNQTRDPNLKKPSFDIGGPVFQNYLLWLQLSELMKLNRKIDKLLKKNA